MQKKCSLFFDNSIRVDNDIWFSDWRHNGIYQYNLVENTVKRVAEFPEENIFKVDLCCIVGAYQHSLVFMPHYCNKVFIYDIKSDKFTVIEIPNFNRNINNLSQNYLGGVIYKSFLYIVGRACPGIVKVDLDLHKAEVVYEAAVKVDGLKGSYWGYWGVDVSIRGSHIYIPCSYQNAVLIFDIERNEAELVQVGEDSDRYYSISCDDHSFYLTTIIADQTFNVLSWSGEGNLYKKIKIRTSAQYSPKIRCGGQYLWAVTGEPSEIYQINKNNGKIRKFDMKRGIESSGYMAVHQDGLYISDVNGNWYDIDHNGLTDLNIKIEELIDEECWRKYGQIGSCIHENDRFPVQFHIFRILSERPEQKERKQAFIGEAIYHKSILDD